MTDALKTILNHRSIRDYKPDPINADDLDVILQAAQAAPSSINGQQMTIVVVKDQERREKFAEIAGGQTYVAQAPVFLIFCQDYYRAKIASEKNEVDLKIVESLNATLIGSIDVGLAMANAITAAESLGLGTVCIGGIRNDTLQVAKLLNLPNYVFPLCGLVIGHPNDLSALKPRLPKAAVVFEEQYNDNIHHLIDEYDQTMSEYMVKRTNGQSNRNWSESISNFYKHESKRSPQDEMKEKGFLNK